MMMIQRRSDTAPPDRTYITVKKGAAWCFRSFAKSRKNLTVFSFIAAVCILLSLYGVPVKRPDIRVSRTSRRG